MLQVFQRERVVTGCRIECTSDRSDAIACSGLRSEALRNEMHRNDLRAEYIHLPTLVYHHELYHRAKNLMNYAAFSLIEVKRYLPKSVLERLESVSRSDSIVRACEKLIPALRRMHLNYIYGRIQPHNDGQQ